MKLIKIKTDHYVVVDETKEIQTNDKYLTSDNRIVNWHKEFEENIKENRPSPITHSTQPLNKSLFFTDRVWGCERLSLGEVKELIGEVDVEDKANTYGYATACDNNQRKGFIDGYKESLEDNKEKKYTEEDLAEAILRTIDACNKAQKDSYGELEIDEEVIIQSLQPKTEWEVEIVDGKLKLK